MADDATTTVTLLFTDIEGSLRRWDEHPEAMRAAQTRHDDALAGIVAAHGGRVFKTIGDSFCVAFANAGDALDSAVAVQIALSGIDWSTVGPGLPPLTVRAAIHTGAVQERDGDYFGVAVGRVARLMAAGHGGQILLSLVARELVYDELPDGVGLRDLGEHRLRDLARPERVFQVVAPGLGADFPPLRTLDVLPNNLPVQLTSFVGREAQVAEVAGLLAERRLVTVTGVGGAGKTRLALQVAADTVEGYPDGAWFVDLAPIVDPGLVVSAAARALGVKETPGVPLEETLSAHVRPRSLLLVLDNCEHLVHACAEFVESMLQLAPHLRVLATSREALLVPGETTWEIPPLTLPAPGGHGAQEAAVIGQFEAVRLFVERAVAARPDFQVTNDTAPFVAEICSRLDGIPLGIELAAARVRTFSLQELLERLDSRLRVLGIASRIAAPRQQTLRAAIDWSHDLLTTPEATLFRRLAVFRGGWGIRDAEIVCGFEPLEPLDVFELLGRLAEKSLVVAEDRDGVHRFRFLETIAEYARERHRAAPEFSTTRARHARRYADVADEVATGLRGADWKVAAERADRDRDNIRAAIARSLATDELAATAVRLCARLGTLAFYGWSGIGEAEPQLAAAARIEGADVDARDRATVLYWHGCVTVYSDQSAEAQARLERALAASVAVGDGQLEAWCHTDLGNVAVMQGDLPQALFHAEEALRLKRSASEAWDVVVSMSNIAEILMEEGDLAGAARKCAEARVLWEAGAEEFPAWATLTALLQEGDVALESGDFALADVRYKEAAATVNADALTLHLGELLARVAWLAAERGEWSRAATLLGASRMAYDATGVTTSSWRITARRGPSATAATRTALGDAAYEAALATGEQMSVPDAIGLVVATD